MSEDSTSETIRILVWSAHYAFEDVVDWVADDADDDSGRVRSEVLAEWERKAADELTWQMPTDCDRLNDAFDELWERNIIALQAVGDMYFDGSEDVESYWARTGRDLSPVVGYCFCHQQEVKNCLDGGTLMLAFGDIFGRDPERNVAVGRTVCGVLEHHGFMPVWDETDHTRIALPGFQWRKTRASFLQHEARLEEHCAALRAQVKRADPPPPARLDLRSDAPVVLMRLARLYVLGYALAGPVAAAYVLWKAQVNHKQPPAFPPVYAWLGILLSGFAFLFGVNRWGRWWYAVPLWVGPVVFLSVTANFAEFAPSMPSDEAVGISTLIAIAVGLQAAWGVRNYFNKSRKS